MYRKIIAGITALMTLFAVCGCNAQEPETSVQHKGRYVETEVSIAADPYSIGELFIADGQISFVDKFSMRRYVESEDGEKFNAASFPSVKALGEVTIFQTAAAPDGGFFILYYVDGSADTQYAFISAEGAITQLSLDMTIHTAEYSPDGRLFVCDNTGVVYEILTDSQSAKELFRMEGNAAAFDIVNAYVIAVDKDAMYFYDYENNTMIETPEAMQHFLEGQGLSAPASGVAYDFCSGEDGAFYIVSKNGLYRYIMNGNQVEQLIDGFSCHLGNPSYTVSSVICDTDGSFLIGYEQNVVMRYAYDAAAENEITGELNIYSLTENDTLSQAISEYKTKNPTIQVNYEVGMRSGVTYEDAMKNLTTEILAGDSPDVMMLDGLDIDNYIEKHILLDLSENESIWNPDDLLLDNIAKWNHDGGLWSVACRFELPVLAGTQDFLDGVDGMSDLARATENFGNEESSISFFYTAEQILKTMLQYSGDEIMTEDGLNEEKLLELLKSSAVIYRETHCNELPADWAQEIYEETERNPEVHDTGSLAAFALADPEIWLYTTGTADSFDPCLNTLSSLHETFPYAGYRFGLSEDDHIFLPSCNLAICAAAENREEAEKFLSIAISDAVQNVVLYDGFPVNQRTLEKYYSKNLNPNNYTTIETTNVKGEWFTYYIKWMDSEEVIEFKQVLNSLDTPILLDTQTYDTIIEVGTKCLDGSISAEQAVEEITAQLALRMKE